MNARTTAARRARLMASLDCAIACPTRVSASGWESPVRVSTSRTSLRVFKCQFLCFELPSLAEIAVASCQCKRSDRRRLAFGASSFGHRCYKISRFLRSRFESWERLLANISISERFYVVIIVHSDKSRAEGNHDWPEQDDPPTTRGFSMEGTQGNQESSGERLPAARYHIRQGIAWQRKGRKVKRVLESVPPD
jgi:hypothetical protein